MDTFQSLKAAGRQRLWAELAGLWASRSLRLALVLMVLGGVLWVRDGRQPAGAAPPVAPVTAGSPEVVPSTPRQSAVRPPVTFRLGAGYVGGFLIGFAFRRFLKVTAAVAALLLGGIALLKATGLVELDWAGVENQIRESLAWTHGWAASLKTLLTGYLPSAGAGGLGLWKGFRRPPASTAA